MSLDANIGRVVIGIGGMAVHQGGSGFIVTHALGSCVGVTIWDAQAKIGGMLHAQLPLSTQNKVLAEQRPGLFVDTGMAALLIALDRLGGNRRRLRLCVAGGASIMAPGTISDVFNIGSRNLTVLRKILWQNGLLIAAEESAGTVPRTLSLDFATGTARVSTAGNEKILA